jgi:transcriptional regulator with XRE-family HTH domain
MTKQPRVHSELGLRLKVARERAGIDQDELGKTIKKSRRTIVRWEAGESSPSRGDLSLMATLFNVVPAWLLTGEGPMSTEETASPLLVADREGRPRAELSLQKTPPRLPAPLLGSQSKTDGPFTDGAQAAFRPSRVLLEELVDSCYQKIRRNEKLTDDQLAELIQLMRRMAE